MSRYNSLQGCMFPASNYKFIYKTWTARGGVSEAVLPSLYHYCFCDIQKMNEISFFILD